MTDITADEYRTAEKVARSLGFVTAQSYADHAARLESEGTVPAGGIALTAEQVEDVRTAREELRGYRNFTGYGRSHVNRLIEVVDALFPATEPAEEETKAEEHRSIIHSNRTIKTVGEALSYAETALLNAYPESGQRAHYAEVIAELLRDVARQRPVGSNGKHGELHTPRCGCEDVPASSPVVPAPNETEWPTWDAVPENVTVVSSFLDHRYRKVSGEVFRVLEDGKRHKAADFTPTDMRSFAPFVAAEEG